MVDMKKFRDIAQSMMTLNEATADKPICSFDIKNYENGFSIIGFSQFAMLIPEAMKESGIDANSKECKDAIDEIYEDVIDKFCDDVAEDVNSSFSGDKVGYYVHPYDPTDTSAACEIFFVHNMPVDDLIPQVVHQHIEEVSNTQKKIDSIFNSEKQNVYDQMLDIFLSHNKE